MESLADVGLVTVQRFKLLEEAKQLESVTSQIQEWPANLFRAQFDRFELWAVNLGLFVMGHGSLDYRIRDSESMKESMYKMIQNLNRSLDEVLDYVNGNTDAGDEDSDTDSELESDIDLLLGSIKDPIDRLYKLAVWIRNPATRLASSKARNFKQIDEYSNVDLFESYKSHDYDYVSSLFLEYEKHRAMQEDAPVECKDKASVSGDGEVDSSDHVWEPIRGVLRLYKDKVSKGSESYLVQRIARANGRRRQQFAYWKRHKDKLREHASSFVEAPTRQLTDEEHINNGHSGETKTPLSVTTATQLRLAQAAGHEILEKEGVLKLDVSEYAPSAWNPSKDTVSFPPPPKRPTSDNFFECPYCFTICPISLLSEKAWRAHVIRDLRPYVCTYEQCFNSEQLYDTREDWNQHEMSTHQKIYRCFEHEEETFTTLAAYEEHVQDHHERNEVSSKFATSTLRNVHRSCPVCSIVLGSIQKLQSHIALHLERFAMFSLPRHTDNTEEQSEAESQSDNAQLESNSFLTADLQTEWAVPGSPMIPSIHSELEITESFPPVSEALLPIYGQLLTLKRCLREVKDSGGVSSVRELYPYSMKLNTIDNLRVDGKFVVNGNIPEGQNSINELLAECFDLNHDLRVAAEDATADTPKLSASSTERAQEDAHLQEETQVPQTFVGNYEDDGLEKRDGSSTARRLISLEVAKTAIASGELPQTALAEAVSSDSNPEHAHHFISDVQPLPAGAKSDAGSTSSHLGSSAECAEDGTHPDEDAEAPWERKLNESIEKEIEVFGIIWREMKIFVDKEIELENEDGHGGSEALDLLRKMEIDRLEVEAQKDEFDKETLREPKFEKAHELSNKARAWDLTYVQNGIKDIQANRKKRKEKRELEKLEAEHKAAVELERKAAALDEAKRKAEEAAEKGGAEPAPLKFKDAVGRKFSFPFHLCNTWQGMEELIKQAFLHVDVIGPHVQEGHYDLIGPEGEIILPAVWDKVIEPGWSITMTMWPLDTSPPVHGSFYPPPYPGYAPAGLHQPGARMPPPPPPPPGWNSGIRPPPSGSPFGYPSLQTTNAALPKRKNNSRKSNKSNPLLSFLAGKPPNKKRPVAIEKRDNPSPPKELGDMNDLRQNTHEGAGDEVTAEMPKEETGGGGGGEEEEDAVEIDKAARAHLEELAQANASFWPSMPGMPGMSMDKTEGKRKDAKIQEEKDAGEDVVPLGEEGTRYGHSGYS